MKIVMIKIAVIQLILALFIWLPPASAGAEAGEKSREKSRIAVVLDKNRPVYDKILEGFKNHCDVKTKKFFTAHTPKAEIARMIEYYNPAIALALGTPALEKMIDMKDRPVLYAQVFFPEKIVRGKKNFFGVGMFFSKEKEFKALQGAFNMKLDCIGLVYSEHTEHMLEELRRAAGREGVKILAVKSGASHYTISLENMRKSIDAYWILPDRYVYDRNFLSHLLIYSRMHKIPIFSPFQQYVRKGAAISLQPDPYDEGALLATMVDALISNGKTDREQPLAPRKGVVTINKKIAGEFGVEINKKIGMQDAEVYFLQ